MDCVDAFFSTILNLLYCNLIKRGTNNRIERAIASSDIQFIHEYTKYKYNYIKRVQLYFNNFWIYIFHIEYSINTKYKIDIAINITSIIILFSQLLYFIINLNGIK